MEGNGEGLTRGNECWKMVGHGDGRDRQRLDGSNHRECNDPS
jgi:hypothetical protein